MARRKRSGGPSFSLFAFQDIITCVMGIMLLLTLILSLQIAVSPSAVLSTPMQEQADQLAAETTGLLMEIVAMERQIADQMIVLNSGALLNPQILQRSRDLAVQESVAAQKEVARLEQQITDSEQRLAEVRSEFNQHELLVQESSLLEQKRLNRLVELDDVRSGRRRIYNAHNSDAQTCWLAEISSPNNIRIGITGNESSLQEFASIDELIQWTQTQANKDYALMLLVKPDAASSLELLSKTLVEQKIAFGFDLLPQDTIVLAPNKGQPE